MSVRSRPTVRAGRLGLPTANDLAAEIDRLKSEPSLAGYDEKVRFVLWFLLAYATADDVAAAKGALTGVPGTKERDVDALHIDRRTDGLSVVYVVQGKYREAVLKGGEVGKDVSSFTALGKVLRSASRQEFDSYCDPKLMDELTRRKLEEARGLLLKSRGSLLRLCYVSLSKIGAGVRESATKQLAGVPRTELVAFDGMKTLRLLETYLDGVQRVNDFTLQVADDGTAFFEHDAGGLRTWVFTAEATSVAQWFELEKERLFASNVRGYEGDSRVNRDMIQSLKDHPKRFWHLNNGLTVAATEVRPATVTDTSFAIRGGQIVNGQQTTRALHGMLKGDADKQKLRSARVLVRLVEIPQVGQSAIAEADLARSTNSQNKILASDLMANDRKQIWLQRELRRFNIEYLRKREGIGAARAAAGLVHATAVRRFKLAAAVGSVQRESLALRVGPEQLFDLYYDDIFGSGSIYDYLLPLWLMEELESMLRGSPRKDVKWVVLYFLWEQFASTLREGRGQVRDVMASAVGSKALRGAASEAIKAAWGFYWQRKRVGLKVLRPKPFFQRRTLDDARSRIGVRKSGTKASPLREPKESKLYAEFERYWLSPKNTARRRRFELYRSRFESGLKH